MNGSWIEWSQNDSRVKRFSQSCVKPLRTFETAIEIFTKTAHRWQAHKQKKSNVLYKRFYQSPHKLFDNPKWMTVNWMEIFLSTKVIFELRSKPNYTETFKSWIEYTNYVKKKKLICKIPDAIVYIPISQAMNILWFASKKSTVRIGYNIISNFRGRLELWICNRANQFCYEMWFNQT